MIKIHRRAEMAIDTLSSLERGRVRRAVRLLQDPTSVDIVRSRSAKLGTSDPVVVMRVPPGIRLIFRKTDDEVEVLDVVRRDKLHSFASKKYETAGTVRPSKPAKLTKRTRLAELRAERKRKLARRAHKLR
jgi:hypothetical protein